VHPLLLVEDRMSGPPSLGRCLMAPVMLLLALLSACSTWHTIPWSERLLLLLEERW
jgi:hypothetical protein